MIIPWQEIPKEALRNLIEHFVLREGTDYGETEVGIDVKIEHVFAQLKNNEVVILYSELHESFDIRPKTALV